jgi:hypothetical protein
LIIDGAGQRHVRLWLACRNWYLRCSRINNKHDIGESRAIGDRRSFSCGEDQVFGHEVLDKRKTLARIGPYGLLPIRAKALCEVFGSVSAFSTMVLKFKKRPNESR